MKLSRYARACAHALLCAGLALPALARAQAGADNAPPGLSAGSMLPGAAGGAAPPAADPGGYSSSASSADARFGALLGAGTQAQALAPAPAKPMSAFTGGGRFACTSVDYNAFLHSFDPSELLGEMRNSLLAGAQAAASNYLLTLSYASPTLASVLDMLDKKYAARYAAFSQACASQHAQAQAHGQDAAASTLAAASDQCLNAELGRGTAPTLALRRCSAQQNLDGMNLPASASNGDFLRRFTRVRLSADQQALLALLPDERVAQGAYQMRAPQWTLAELSERLRARTRTALDRIEAGSAAASIAACSPQSLLADRDPRSPCLPPAALPLVASPAFRGTRLLGASARSLFKDAVALQIARAAVLVLLRDFDQSIARIDVPAGSGGDAIHASARRAQLRKQIAQLWADAEAEGKMQDAMGQVLRSQMLALEQLEASLDARGRNLQGQSPSAETGRADRVLGSGLAQ